MQVSKVLVVDGDRAARDALVTCLKFVGVEAHGAENAAAVLPNYPIDDMLRRPIALSRVVERVESLIQERSFRRGVLLRFGALALDMAKKWVTAGDRSVELSHTETRLLAFFFAVPDRVFSRAQLLQRLWPSNARVEDRTVDVHIRRLRLALGRLGCAGYIQTVRGSGYRFSAL